MRIGRSGRAVAWGEDKLDGGGTAWGVILIIETLSDEDVTGSAVEESGEHLCRSVGTVAAENVLIGDSASDLHSGEAGDGVENLVEAGVVGDDGEAALLVGDGGWMVRGQGVGKAVGGGAGGKSRGRLLCVKDRKAGGDCGGEGDEGKSAVCEWTLHSWIPQGEQLAMKLRRDQGDSVFMAGFYLKWWRMGWVLRKGALY